MYPLSENYTQYSLFRIPENGVIILVTFLGISVFSFLCERLYSACVLLSSNAVFYIVL